MTRPASGSARRSAARYVVTGGAGFIGSNLVRALLARGDAVCVVDDLSSGRESNLEGLAGDLEVERGDIRQPDVLERCLRGARAVFHHAAMASVEQSVGDPITCDDINTRGTLRVLESARLAGVQRVVFAASSAAYGDSPEQPKREAMPPAALSPYAASKVAGEQYVRVYAELHGMRTLSLRYFNVFGPRQDPASQYAAVVPKFIESLLRGCPPVIYGDGEQTRDFCHIDNVVDANLRAAEIDGAHGQVVNVATGRSISIRHLLELLQGVVGTSIEPRREPPRPGDVRHSGADVGLARSLLDFEPQVSVEEGLARTVDWYRQTAV